MNYTAATCSINIERDTLFAKNRKRDFTSLLRQDNSTDEIIYYVLEAPTAIDNMLPIAYSGYSPFGVNPIKLSQSISADDLPLGGFKPTGERQDLTQFSWFDARPMLVFHSRTRRDSSLPSPEAKPPIDPERLLIPQSLRAFRAFMRSPAIAFEDRLKLGQDILEFVAWLQHGPYRAVAALDEAGDLALEARLSPQEELFMDIFPDGSVEAAVYRDNSGFQNMASTSLPALKQEILVWQASQ